MSEHDVELHRRILAAYNARDVETFIAYCDPSIEFHSTFSVVGGVYHGREGMREYFRDLEDAWEGDIHVEFEAYFDLGEHTLASFVLHGHGGHSGVQVAMPLNQLGRWSYGLCVYLKSYPDREEALAELGVSEDELERIEP
jgi:ketosteroid isomerase-like protein